MDLSEKILQVLSADAALVALVQDRIFPVVGPTELAAPALLYTIVTGFDLGETHDDGTASAATLAATTVQFTAYSLTRDSALIIQRRVLAAMRLAQEAGTFAVHVSAPVRETVETPAGLRLFRADIDVTVDHTLSV